jgi:MoxR-like ATPase
MDNWNENSEMHESSHLNTNDFTRGNSDLNWLLAKAEKLKQEMAGYVIGQHDMVELMLVGIFSNGHLLLEGAPGVAKTLASKVMARAMDMGFSRIQFTPDLMPSDVIGTSIYNMNEGEFTFKKGPVFSNVVLIDEINRAPAKTQASLFEVMEERQMTYDGVCYPMEFPFLVVATQNPIEQEGTYNLPEAQLDRFLFKIKLGYPHYEEEVQILQRYKNNINAVDINSVNPVFSKTDIQRIQKVVETVRVEDNMLHYIAQLVHKTRNHGKVYLGASPRATLAILKSAKALAALRGRDFVIPDDIQHVIRPVLNHRIILTPDAEMEGVKPEALLSEIMQTIEVPR